MPLAEQIRTAPRKKKRKPVPASKPQVLYRSSDSGEAARFTRSPAYEKTRRRRYRRSDSGEAVNFVRSLEYALLGDHSQAARERKEREREIIELYKQLGEPQAPRFLERFAESENPAVRATVSTMGPSTEDLFEILNSPPARLAHNLAADVEEAAVGFPGGVKEAGSAVGFDLRDIATGRDRTPSRSKELGSDIVEGYRHTYGPLFRGDLETFGERVFEHPLGPALDAAAVASLGTTAAARTSLIRTPARTRRLELDGGTVQPYASPNALTRAGQHAYDRLSEKRPDMPLLGARSRVTRRIPFEREREFDRAKAPAIPFARARKKLSRSEDFAYDRLARYGWATPDERRQTLELLDREIAMRRERLRGKVTAAENAGQRKQLVQLRLARKHVEAPSPKLLAALDEGSQLQARSQDTKIETRQLTPEAAGERVDLSARLVSGATAERTPARQGRAEHVREYAIGEKTTERPRTAEEARARLAELDAAYTEIIGGIERMFTGGQPADRVEVARRNRWNAGNKNKRRGRPRMPTVYEEVRKLAEAELDKVIASRPDSPEVRQIVALLEERKALTEAVNDPERVFDGKEVDFGTVSESEPAQILRRHFEAQAPQRAETRIVGADDVEAGESAFFVPDVARAPIKSVGSRVRSVVGKPRRLVYQNEGVLFTQGRTRTGSKLTLEDFAKTTRYQAQLLDIDEVGEFARPLTEGTSNGLDGPHMRYFNPEGVELPRSFRDEPAAAELEGLTPRELGEQVRADHDALVRHTFPTEAEVLRLPPEVLTKVRQVDGRIVDAFTRGGARYNGFGHGIARVLAELFDAANNVTRAGVLYLKGSFIPMNFLADTGLLTIQGGVFAPANLARAARLMGGMDVRTLRRLDLEVGGGAPLALAGEGRGLLGGTVHKMGEVSNTAASLLTRRAAVIHELRKLGLKSEEKVRALLDAADEGGTITVRGRTEDADTVLNQVSELAENAMVRYRGGSQFERDVVTRAIFVYPWIKGSTRYAVQLPFDKPIRADFIAHLGAEGYEEVRDTLGQLASYFETLVPIGPAEEKLGSTVVPVTNPTSVTPFGTGVDVLRAARGALVGGTPQRARLINFASPAIQTAVETATGFNTFGGYPYDPGMSGLEIAKEASGVGEFPLARLFESIGDKPQTAPFTGSPASQRNYVEGGFLEALGRFFAGGLMPRELNLPAAQEKGYQEALELKAPGERSRVRREREVRERIADARRLFASVDAELPPLYRDLVNRHALYEAAQDAIREDADIDSLSEAQRVLALIAVADQTPHLEKHHDAFVAAWQNLRGSPLDELDRPRGPMSQYANKLRQILGFNELSELEAILNRIREREAVLDG